MTTSARFFRSTLALLLGAVFLLGCDSDDPTINTKPTPTFTVEASGFNVSLDASESTDPDGSISAYEWEFGDGETAEGASVSHQYAETGEYQITLIITDDQGNQSTATEFFTVEPRTVTYPLDAVSNGGAIPDGVEATATFQEVTPTTTLVTLALENGATGAAVSHPAHIHENDRETGGPINIFLAPIDGLGSDANPGTSTQVVNRPFDEMVNLNGYINIHESPSALGNVVAQGNIGENADPETTESGTNADILSNGRSRAYTLAPQSNNGAFPNGVAGTIEFIELTSGSTLVLASLDGGPTGATVGHPIHIHDGPAERAPGNIQIFVAPIDPTNAPINPAQSGQIVDVSYDAMLDYNGYVNIHESNANLGAVVAQGNIGTNANGFAGTGF